MDDHGGVNDRVIISGGFGPIGSGENARLGALVSSDIYTPGTRMFTQVVSIMNRPRQEHTALLLDEAVSSGYLRLTSEMGLLASGRHSLEKGGAPTSISAINMARYIDVTTIYSPRFVLDRERTTMLNVINGNEETAEITLELRNDRGGVIASRTRRVAGNEQIKGTLAAIFGNSVSTNMHGWIKVSSTHDQVVGIVTFMSPERSYLGSFELSGTPSPRFVFPLVTENADFETELSFLNSGTDAASLSLELWDEGGGNAPLVTTTVTLAAGASTYNTLSGFFRRTLNTGNVRVISNRPVHGMGEIRAKSGRFITPVPATAY
jgi:hypothetical protein